LVAFGNICRSDIFVGVIATGSERQAPAINATVRTSI